MFSYVDVHQCLCNSHTCTYAYMFVQNLHESTRLSSRTAYTYKPRGTEKGPVTHYNRTLPFFNTNGRVRPPLVPQIHQKWTFHLSLRKTEHKLCGRHRSHEQRWHTTDTQIGALHKHTITNPLKTPSTHWSNTLHAVRSEILYVLLWLMRQQDIQSL